MSRSDNLTLTINTAARLLVRDDCDRELVGAGPGALGSGRDVVVAVGGGAERRYAAVLSLAVISPVIAALLLVGAGNQCVVLVEDAQQLRVFQRAGGDPDYLAID